MAFLYPGAIHIHSIHSDGTGTIEEIARAAKKAGLHWIIITDHNNMDAEEGMYDGVCVIVGEEISPDRGNHYVALDIKTPISCDMPVEKYIQKVKEQGGFGFIAHPDDNSRKNSYNSLPWEDWSMKDFGGIEIWNYMSNWADSYNAKNPFKALNSFLFRNHVPAPTKKIMKWWDSLNSENHRIVPAIGGVDAHAFNIKKAFITVKVFPYENIFGTIVNFIYHDEQLPGNFECRKKVILDSIKSGKNLIINRGGKCGKRGKGKIFNPVFYIQNGHKRAYAGDFISLNSNLKMVIGLPLKAQIKVINNGEIILQKIAKNLEIDELGEGKYRIEVYYKKRPWIFSNPISIIN